VDEFIDLRASWHACGIAPREQSIPHCAPASRVRGGEQVRRAGPVVIVALVVPGAMNYIDTPTGYVGERSGQRAGRAVRERRDAATGGSCTVDLTMGRGCDWLTAD
jgi:hypothetical protein